MKRRIAYKVMESPKRYSTTTLRRALRVVRRDARRGRPAAVEMTRLGRLLPLLFRLSETQKKRMRRVGRDAARAMKGFGEAAQRLREALERGLVSLPTSGRLAEDLQRYRWKTTNDPTPRH
jgi:hypothetical protein